MLPQLPPGYAVRPPTLADLDAAYALTMVVDLAEAGESDADNGDMLLDWEKADLDHDAWLVHAPGGELVAYALVTSRAQAELITDLYLHPAHHERGIGMALNRLIEGRANALAALAAPDMRVTLSTYINAPNERAERLLAEEGYALQRHFWRMQIALEAAPPAPEWPTGFVARPYDPARDAERVYATITESFNDMWGYIPPDYTDWCAFMIDRPDFDPALFTIVEDDGEVVAVACAYQYPDRGNIRNLAVRRPWRRRGLALALLHHTFGLFWGRGQRTIALGVDAQSLTGATRLYERAGMQIVRQFAMWEKDLRAGRDLRTRELAE